METWNYLDDWSFQPIVLGALQLRSTLKVLMEKYREDQKKIALFVFGFRRKVYKTVLWSCCMAWRQNGGVVGNKVKYAIFIGNDEDERLEN